MQNLTTSIFYLESTSLTLLLFSLVVDTSELNHDAVDVSVEYLGQLIPYQVVQHISSIDTQMVKFVPKTVGIYTVSVKCLGKHISGSVLGHDCHSTLCWEVITR